LASRYGLTVRAVNAGDAAGIGELLAASGRRLDSHNLAGRLDALQHQQGVALVALEWGPPSGLIILHWYQTLEVAQPIAQVTSLLVAPDARRRGIGRLLLKAAAQAARLAGCGEMHLQASADRLELQAFCHATGFEPTGTGFMRPLRKKA